MEFLIILLNRAIDMLKYPIAFISILLTYELFHVLYEVLSYVYKNLEFYNDFFIGMGIYIFSWLLIFRNISGKWFFVIEHELTHTIFALLTFHTIHDFRATKIGVGYVGYSGAGNGNWLISIAPYFFPTFSIIVIAFLYLAQAQYYPFLMMLLGYTFLYHIHSTIYETHHRQPDLQKVGLWFAYAFLPAANLLAIVAIISAIPNDRIEFLRTLEHLYSYLALLLADILKSIINIF